MTKTLSFFLLILMVGCTCCPRAEPIDVPCAAIEQAQQEGSSDLIENGCEILPEDWWLMFDDPQLTEFIETAFERNPTLQIAHANILLAAANANRVRSFLFPSITLGADVSRQKLSETGLFPTGPPFGLPVYFTQTETELNLTYDFDIWGKNRNAWGAALGEVQAKLADEAFKRLQLGILVAMTYYALQIDYQRINIVNALIRNETEYVELIKQRVDANLESMITLQSAQSNLTAVKQALLQVQADQAANEYQLKTYLAGDFDEEFEPIELDFCSLPRIPIPDNLPLHLIAQRPDIIAQLWLIDSTTKQIKVAEAGFYPDLNLAALFGFQTLHLPKLLTWPSSYFNIDPAISLPIFQGGRLIANLRTSEAQYDLAVYEYNNLVLNAVRDVLDGLALLRNAEQQYQEQKMNLDFQRKSFELTSLRVAHHLNSELDQLVSEENMLIARDQEVVALGNTIQKVLFLIKALGGGYYACSEEN